MTYQHLSDVPMQRTKQHHNLVKYCIGCGTVLTDDNWAPSKQRHSQYRCRKCPAKRNPNAKKIWYYKNRAKAADYNRKYRAANLEHIREQNREYKRKNREKGAEYQRVQYERNPLQFRLRRVKYNEERRAKLFAILGGAKCAVCGFLDVRALQIDHIKGKGLQDARRFSSRDSLSSYYLNHPEEAKEKLQVLCANCNWIKRAVKNEQFKHFPKNL
jgi:hypothetical protein